MEKGAKKCDRYKNITNQKNYATNTTHTPTWNILQVNLDKKHLAHDLLYQFVRDHHIDIVAGQEPCLRIPSSAILDLHRRCFIWLPQKANIQKTYVGAGIVGVWIGGTGIISCYFSPNGSADEFESYMRELDHLIKTSLKNVIICGDLNAKSGICGSPCTNGRGERLEELIMCNHLVPLNDGRATFSNANGSSLIDVTIVSEGILNSIRNWKLLDQHDNGSEHAYITLEFTKTPKETNTPTSRYNGWVLTKAGVEKMCSHLKKDQRASQDPPDSAYSLTEQIKQICNQNLKQKGQKYKNHKPVYWWTEKIADMRAKCNIYRRSYTRAKSKRLSGEIQTTLLEQLKTARKELKSLIRCEKKRSWMALCSDLDDDIWGRGFQIVTKKFRRGTPLSDETVQTQVRKLFPTRKTPVWRRHTVDTDATTTTTEDEVQTIISELKNGKAPGPDKITPEILKIVSKNGYLPYITEVLNNYLSTATFPDEWKVARLVLIEKPRKSADISPSYRPIGIIDTLGKVLEKLVNKRLQAELERLEIIHENQFGFRKGRGTLDAIRSIEDIVKTIASKAYKRQDCCALVTLDIENAFNTASWNNIVDAVKNAKISGHLTNIIQEYFTNRRIFLPGGQTYQMTCGVPQGSVLGPTLWNIFYNKILTSLNIDQVKLVAYADDLAVVAWASNAVMLEERTSLVLSHIRMVLESMGLHLANHKTEATIIRGWERCKQMEIRIDETPVHISRSLKYMGIHISSNWKFHMHINAIKTKTQEMIKQLTRITPKLEGPRAIKKRLLASAVHSTMLYGAPIWESAVAHKNHETTLETINRKLALMITGAYRTAPTTAILALAKIPPVGLLIRERVELHCRGKTEKSAIRSELLESWGTAWQQYGGQTRMLIPDLEKWVNSKWTEVDHYMSQVATGHGVFGVYLHRIGKKTTPYCWYCMDNIPDTTEHTLFVCQRWARHRGELNIKVSEEVNQNNIGTLITFKEEYWSAVRKFITDVMKLKIEDEKNYQLN